MQLILKKDLDSESDEEIELEPVHDSFVKMMKDNHCMDKV